MLVEVRPVELRNLPDHGHDIDSRVQYSSSSNRSEILAMSWADGDGAVHLHPKRHEIGLLGALEVEAMKKIVLVGECSHRSLNPRVVSVAPVINSALQERINKES